MKFDDLCWFVFGAVVPSFITSCLATWAMRGLAPRLGLIDKPNARKVHETPMPMGGGLGIWLGVLLPFALGTLALWYVLGLDSATRARLVPPVALQHLAGLRDRIGGLWILLGCGSV